VKILKIVSPLIKKTITINSNICMGYLCYFDLEIKKIFLLFYRFFNDTINIIIFVFVKKYFYLF